MSLKDEVLKILINDGGYVSGEELSKKLGVSRAYVWKLMVDLRNKGYTIDATTKKGYILRENDEIICGSEIEAKMRHPISVVYYDETDSTNTRAKILLADGKEGDFVVVADKQTAGRGRQGKSFYSPKGTGIYMSLVVHPNSSLKNAVTATTAAAVAVCKAIEELTDVKPKIKWVNDVYVNGNKICGILTEAVSDFESDTVTSVIIGVGVNITTKEFPKDVENAGAIGVAVDRAKMIAVIADNLLETFTGDYDKFINYYRTHSMIIGKKINFIYRGQTTAATAVGIDEFGGLVVKTENGKIQTLRSGEITIRPKKND